MKRTRGWLLFISIYNVHVCPLQVFQTGFRCSRKFQKKLFIWDLLERVQEQLVASETVQPTTFEVGVVRSTSGTERGNSTSPDPETHCQQMFLNAISRINSNNPNVGKDEKVSGNKLVHNKRCVCIS